MISKGKLASLIDRITDAMAIVAALLLFLMMFSICLEVVLRYFDLQPLTWVTEITEYILLYVTFLGAPWLLKEDGHVRVDIIIRKFSITSQKLIDISTSIIGIFVCSILVWFGAETTWSFYTRGIPVIKVLEVPKFLLLGVIPFGSLFLIIQFIRRVRGLYEAFSSERIMQKESGKLKSGL